MQLREREIVVVGELPDFFRRRAHVLQIGVVPLEVQLLPFQPLRAILNPLAQMIEMIAHPDGVDQDFVALAGERAAFAPARADLRFVGEGEGTGTVFVEEKLPEGLLAAEMLEAAPARSAFLEIESRDRLAVFVRDREQAGLPRLDDRLVDGDDVEVGQAAGELERIIRRMGQLPRLEETGGQFPGEKEKERWNPLKEFREIAPAKTLQAEGGAGTGRVIARMLHQRPGFAENIAPGKDRCERAGPGVGRE